MSRGRIIRRWGTSLILALLLIPVSFPGEAHDPQDVVLQRIGVDERPGAQLPLNLLLTDAQGNPVRLADAFTGMPVVITLNYYSCPTLCPQVIQNLVRTIRGMGDLSLGRDFRIVTVSIDPDEELSRAREKAATTYAMLGAVPDPGRSWPFLTAQAPAIDRLTGSAGVRFVKLASGEIAHPNVVLVATPKGRISRYLYGIELEPRDLKLALIEAAGGRIGTSHLLNRALLYCFHYDPVGKKYVLIATRVMTGAMLLVLLLMGGLMAALWRREPRTGGRGKHGPEPTQ